MSIAVRARYGSGRRASWLFVERGLDRNGRTVDITAQAKAQALAKARQLRARGTRVWIDRTGQPATASEPS